MTTPKSLFVRLGDALFRLRNVLFPLFLVALSLWRAPVEDYALAPGLEEWKDLLAVLVVLTGLAIRATVIGFRYIQRGGRDKRVHADDLVTGGIFALCRNPLYVGNLVICAGLLLMHGDPVVIAVGMAAFLIAYNAIVRAEETFLTARFGADYAAYMRDVPRWLPRLGRFRAATAGMEFNWSRVLAKDYTTLVSAFGTLLLIEQWEHVQAGLAAHWPRFAALAALLVVLLAGISQLKKRRLIGRT